MSLPLEKRALPPPTLEEAKLAADHARYRAAVARDDVVFALHTRILEPEVSTKQLIDAGVYFDKVVGDSKRDEQTQQGFSITINIPQVGGRAGERLVVSTEDSSSMFDSIPASVMLLPQTNDLVCETLDT